MKKSGKGRRTSVAVVKSPSSSIMPASLASVLWTISSSEHLLFPPSPNSTYWCWGVWCPPLPRRWGLVPQLLNKGLGALESNFWLLNYTAGIQLPPPPTQTPRCFIYVHANSIMSCNQQPRKNPLPGAIDMNALWQLRSRCVPSVDVTAPPFRSKTSRKQKTLGVSSVNTEDTLQNIQWSPPGPKAESPGDVLPDSVINDSQPDTISQTMQLPHPASEAESPGDVLPDSVINDSQPSHPASVAESPGDLLPDSALESRKRKRPEEESTSSVLNISEGTHAAQKWRLELPAADAALTSRPRPCIMHSHPSTNIAYWDDPEFFRSRMSGS
ncbi:hypothetical protein K503DRAFT_786269 [Rhizopogon vinicolor AM-OR11-026]|uniref:Uncharacterized protein n=1 Tax=Rhizopogon vinicolor AM-OR11-026 TaxID=1314800 RepID=A0A1B7MME9_9AGAM|nr:hypothetical protein K503DRAFT_786269 [Rhizopogon vinicolor AM-OR11-026]